MDKNNNMNKYLSMVIALIFIVLIYTIKTKITKNNGLNENLTDDEVCIFIQESCIHCHDLKRYCEKIDTSKYNLKFYDIKDRKNLDLLLKYANKHHISFMELGTPAIFTKSECMIGFDLDDKDEEKFIELLDKSIEEKKKINKQKDMVKIPLLGSFSKTETNTIKTLFLCIWSYFFSIHNIYSLIFITLVFLMFNIKNKRTVVISYFSFLMIIKFFIITNFINVSVFIRLIRISIFILSYYVIYSAINKITSVNKNDFENNKFIEKLPTYLVFFITFLTFVSAITEFIQPINILNIYEYKINEQSISKFNYFLSNFAYVFSTTTLSLLLFCICYFLLKKVKFLKNNLTIINEVLKLPHQSLIDMVINHLLAIFLHYEVPFDANDDFYHMVFELSETYITIFSIHSPFIVRLSLFELIVIVNNTLSP